MGEGMTDSTTTAWRCLAAAILRRAVLDARSGGYYASSARAWLLASDMAANLLDGLGIEREEMQKALDRENDV